MAAKSRAAFLMLVCAFTLFAVSARGADTTAPGSWWMQEDEGWFFYNERNEPSPPEPEPEKEQTGVRQGDELFTDTMERLGKELMSRAVENPTEDNVKAYMEHNKAMLAASGNFSRMWQKVIMKYPHLLFEQGLNHATKDIEEAIASLAGRAGLYFFHSSSCDACKKQAPVLEGFSRKHGIAVFPVSLDGGTFPEFPNAVPDNGMAAKLGVTTVPALFLAFPSDGRIERIAQGFVDSFDLERRLYNYATPIDTEEVDALLDSAGYLRPLGP